MKTIIQYFSVFALLIFTVSCKKDNPIATSSPLEGLSLIQTIKNSQHDVELYNESGSLTTGYNKIALRIKSKDGSIIKNADINWQPMMQMTMMAHACPSVKPVIDDAASGIHQGALIFQMASNPVEYWELTLNYTIDNVPYSAKDKIVVKEATKRRVSAFKGTDNVNYVLALVSPTKPKVGINDVEAMLFKMENMTTFSTVDQYTIKLDPRMPGMGNHGSPNNIDLTSTAANGLYKGKLSLTMTGYWKINLQLINSNKEVLKGEAIAGNIESSSLYWEIEF